MLIALREDTLAGLDRFKGRIVSLFDNRLALQALSEGAAREAIERPIARYKSLRAEPDGPAELEDGLSREVIRQLPRRSRPHAAVQEPLPTHPRHPPRSSRCTSSSLWHACGDRARGGVPDPSHRNAPSARRRRGDIRGHVGVATARLSHPDQDAAARIFRFLVTPSGGKVALTAHDLALYADLPNTTVQRVLDTLAGGRPACFGPSRLPRRPDPTAYEIFHDSLASPILDWSRRLREHRLQRRVRRLRIALAAAVAIAVGLALYLLDPGPIQRLELLLVDARFAVRRSHRRGPQRRDGHG